MKVFEKRPLSLILCIMLCVFSLFLSADALLSYIAIGISILVFVASFLFKNLFTKKRILLRLCCIAFIAAVCLSQLFIFVFVPQTPKETPVRIKGLVTEIDYSASGTTSFVIQVSEMDASAVSYKMLVSAGKDEAVNIAAGDTVALSCTINSENLTAYIKAQGFNAQATYSSDLTILETNPDWQPSFFTRMREAISASLKLYTDRETGGFLAALLTGEKSGLDDNTELNFKLIGISHILALSGMHLIILTDALRRFLSFIKMNKRVVIVVSTLFAVFYMLLTGCPSSIVRATVMLIITNSLFLLSSTNDTYTTLPLAVTLILIFQPYAVYDVGLWLSAFATVGVVILSDIKERLKKEHGDVRTRNIFIRILVWLRDSILETVFAIIATFALTSSFAGTTSALAPLTTLIFSFPINALIYVSIIVLLIGWFIPIGTPVIFIVDAIKELAEYIASQRWAIISAEFPFTQALTWICTFFFVALLILKIDKLRLSVIVLVILYIMPLVSGIIETQIVTNTDISIYNSSSSSDRMFIRSKGECALIYSGNFSAQDARSCSSALSKQQIYYMEKLILTGYTTNTPSFVKDLVTTVKADVLYAPTPHNTDELSIATALADELSLIGASLDFYESAEAIQIGEIKYRQIDRTLYSDVIAPTSIYTLTINDNVYCYLSEGALEHLPQYSSAYVYQSDYIILGASGEGYSSSFSFEIISESIKGIYYAKTTRISEYAKEYYNNKGVPIYKIGTHNLYIE